jgi:hypothetical protein
VVEKHWYKEQKSALTTKMEKLFLTTFLELLTQREKKTEFGEKK